MTRPAWLAVWNLKEVNSGANRNRRRQDEFFRDRILTMEETK